MKMENTKQLSKTFFEALKAWKLHAMVCRMLTRDEALQYVADIHDSLK